ncbi:MAG: hypothetical protein AAFO06_16010 [Cyanobacteria bacterium J06597_16]
MLDSLYRLLRITTHDGCGRVLVSLYWDSIAVLSGLSIGAV